MFKFLAPKKKEVPAPVAETPAPACAQPAPTVERVDRYVTTPPCAQNVLDIFKGEWNSKLPGELAHLSSGPFDTFNAPSINWGIPVLGGVQGQSVLDLGPLEGGNSYMLCKLGAASVTAVEANTRHYLKCLAIKELYNLDRVRFLCGDCVGFLKQEPRRFDLVVANGILYHMQNPVELISLLSKTTDRVLMCTHYYDHKILDGNPAYTTSRQAVFEGFAHTLHRHEYRDVRFRPDFSGGTAPFSHWLERKDVLGALEHFGFKNVQIAHEDPVYKYGPAFTLAASKK